MLRVYRHFCNHDRANQSLACGNRPPFEAFSELPRLSHVPETVDPDAWLTHYHRQIFRRRVGQNGIISIGRHNYYVGYQHAKENVGALLDADNRVLYIVHKGKVIRELEIQGLVGAPMPFQTYLKHMLEEACTLKID